MNADNLPHRDDWDIILEALERTGINAEDVTQAQIDYITSHLPRYRPGATITGMYHRSKAFQGVARDIIMEYNHNDVFGYTETTFLILGIYLAAAIGYYLFIHGSVPIGKLKEYIIYNVVNPSSVSKDNVAEIIGKNSESIIAKDIEILHEKMDLALSAIDILNKKLDYIASLMFVTMISTAIIITMLAFNMWSIRKIPLVNVKEARLSAYNKFKFAKTKFNFHYHSNFLPLINMMIVSVPQLDWMLAAIGMFGFIPYGFYILYINGWLEEFMISIGEEVETLLFYIPRYFMLDTLKVLTIKTSKFIEWLSILFDRSYKSIFIYIIINIILSPGIILLLYISYSMAILYFI